MSEIPFNKILVILNPISGGVDKSNIYDQLVELAQQYGLNQKIYKTTGKDDNKEISKLLNEFKPDIVLAGGGDGTINLTVGCLMERRIPIGIIPLGSANGLATELQIPADLEGAYETAIKGTPTPVDVLEINGEHLCLHLSDLGFNANLIKRFEAEEKRGKFAYVRQFFKEYLVSKSAKFTFNVNGNVFVRKALMVVFANATKYGTGAIINPRGELGDGKFEICIIKPYPWYAIFGLAFSFFLGRLDKSRYVKMLSTRHVVVTTKKPQAIHVDGEIIGSCTKVTARVLDKGIKIMKPRP